MPVTCRVWGMKLLLWEEVTNINDVMMTIIEQVLELVHRNHMQPRKGYQFPTRFTRMDMTKFTKDDVNGWILKCENFFKIDGTPEDNKVAMANITLDELGYLWFQGFERIKGNEVFGGSLWKE